MNLTKRRWIVLAASCLINLCIGSIYTWSVFTNPMAEHLSQLTGNPNINLSIVFTVALAVSPITMISGGFINDRFGPRWIIFMGGLFFGGGMILSGFTRNALELLATYGLCAGLAVGMVYGCTVSNSVKFFPDRRGLAGGIATAFYGISSVLVSPIANMLITRMDVTAAFKILGAAMMLVICTAAFLIIPCPKGFVPEGHVVKNKQTGQSAAPVEKNWQGMLGDPIFYIMILMLSCGAFSGLMAISQASPIAQRMIGMNVTQAAIAVSVLALFNTGGRILAGFASDKIGTVNTLRTVFVTSACGLTALYFCHDGSTMLFYAGLCLVGLTFGSIMGIFPGFTAAQFGSKNNSVNYGIMFIGFALAGYFGPMIMSRIYTQTGAYQGAFLTAVLIAATGFSLSYVYNYLSKKEFETAQYSTP